jgi:c(7)-type cytochrome triheme protein
MATPEPRAGRAGASAAVRRAVSWLVCAIAAVVGIAGCSPENRYRVLALLFDEVPQPGEDARVTPVVRSPRRPPPPTPTPVPTPAEVVQARTDGNGPTAFRTWDDVMRLLPKDQVGNPDWVGALEEKVIAPRPGVAPEASEPNVLTLDVEITPKSDPAFKVIFSHQKHGAWLACTNCHTGMFEMKAGATPMAAGDAHAERYCGACHGKVAFDIVTGCPLCHLQNLPKDPNGRVDWSRALAEKLIAPRSGPRSKSVDQPTLDLDVEFKPQEQPALKSVFSHTTHTKWLACANCHPGIFPMQAGVVGAKPGDLHARRYCGACHGSVAFGMIGFCGRCHPALEKARQHQEVLDLDTEITPKSQPSVKTVFSHKTHRWVECATCHTSLFETTAGATKMPMADVYGGKYCATCHGKVASDLITPCQRCHASGDTK